MLKKYNYLLGAAMMCLVTMGVKAQTLAPSLKPEFLNAFGSSLNDGGYAVATDASGNVYSGGYFNGTVDVDPSAATHSLTSNGQNDGYLIKQNASGQLIWAKQIGGTDYDYIRGIICDASGNIYVGGMFRGTCDFDDGPGVSNQTAVGMNGDLYVAKYNGTTGALLWVKHVGGSQSEMNSFVMDGTGAILVTGFFNSATDFDPGAGSTVLTPNVIDAFVLKWDNNGTFVWAKSVGGAGIDFGKGITVDASNNIYINGSFGGKTYFTTSLGLDSITPQGNDDAYVAKLDASGNYIWMKGMGGTDYDSADDIELDQNGDVISVGYFRQTADLNPGAGTASFTAYSYNGDGYVQKLDANGNFLWAKQYRGGMNPVQVVCDGNNNIVITGSMSGQVDMDPSSAVQNVNSNVGSYDAFISVLDNGGNYVLGKALGSNGTDWAMGLAVDNANNIILTGQFSATMDFNPNADTLAGTPAGNSDAFVVKYTNCNTILNASSAYFCGSPFLLPDGTTTTSPGTYEKAYAVPGGCDSIVRVTLDYMSMINAIPDEPFMCSSDTDLIRIPDAKVGLRYYLKRANDNTIIDGPVYASTNTYLNPGLVSATTAYYATAVSLADSTCTTQTNWFTITVDPITSQNLYADDTLLYCSGSSTLYLGNSQQGINYYLKNSENDTLIEGPIEGTDGVLFFNTLSPDSTITYKVEAHKISGALYLNGNYAYGITNYSVNSSYTKEAMIYLTSYSGSNNIFSGNNDAFFVPNGFLSAGHNGSWFEVSDSDPLPLNEWVHVALTYDAGTNTLSLYKNGQLVSSSASSLISYYGQEQLGAYQYANFFQGKLDEVRVWNTARTQAEIQANMNACLTGTEANLDIYFQFEEGPGNYTTYNTAPGNYYVNIGNMTWTTSYEMCASCSKQMSNLLTVHVKSIDNQPLSSAQPNLCTPGYANASIPTSENGVNYYLASQSDSSLIYGPFYGNGSPVYFTTPYVNDSASFIVYAESNMNSMCNTIMPSVLNIHVNNPINVSQSVNLCAGQSVTVGTNTYNTAGTYTDVLIASNGCDSTVTTTVTINNPVDITTSTTAETITANATGATYQWIDCDNGNTPIAGETNASYTATANGNYAVIVTIGSCTDTSNCVSIVSVSLKENSIGKAKVFPNPNNGAFTIKAFTEVEYTLTNSLGQMIQSIRLNASNNYTITITDIEEGVYFLRSTQGAIQQKIVVVK